MPDFSTHQESHWVMIEVLATVMEELPFEVQQAVHFGAKFYGNSELNKEARTMLWQHIAAAEAPESRDAMFARLAICALYPDTDELIEGRNAFESFVVYFRALQLPEEKLGPVASLV